MTIRHGEIRGSPEDLEAFADSAELPRAPQALPRRIALEPEKVEQGLTQLVLSVVELLRRLLEKQAIRRVEGGSLSADEVERLGTTLMKLEEQMEMLKDHFHIESLDIDLGPLGNLFDDQGPQGRS
ncbi:MAG: gas vesicle protein K [Deltaproteobacteria bacterium]